MSSPGCGDGIWLDVKLPQTCSWRDLVRPIVALRHHAGDSRERSRHDEYTPIFADILRSLTGVEIGLLDALFEEFLSYYRQQGYTDTMPIQSAVEHIQAGDEASVADHLIRLGHLQAARWEDLFTHGSPLDQQVRFEDLAKLKMVLDSLIRNQLLRSGQTRNGREALWLTTLGIRFLQASRPTPPTGI
jgi:hypothetical protein